MLQLFHSYVEFCGSSLWREPRSLDEACQEGLNSQLCENDCTIPSYIQKSTIVTQTVHRSPVKNVTYAKNVALAKTTSAWTSSTLWRPPCRLDCLHETLLIFPLPSATLKNESTWFSSIQPIRNNIQPPPRIHGKIRTTMPAQGFRSSLSGSIFGHTQAKLDELINKLLPIPYSILSAASMLLSRRSPEIIVGHGIWPISSKNTSWLVICLPQ